MKIQASAIRAATRARSAGSGAVRVLSTVANNERARSRRVGSAAVTIIQATTDSSAALDVAGSAGDWQSNDRSEPPLGRRVHARIDGSAIDGSAIDGSPPDPSRIDGRFVRSCIGRNGA